MVILSQASERLLIFLWKVQRLSREGVPPSGGKCRTPIILQNIMGGDIVCSIWKHIAGFVPGEEVASFSEH